MPAGYNQKRYREKHPDRCFYCGRLSEDPKCPNCRESHRVAWRSLQQRTKDAAFGAYGGYECVCCGETHPYFLTIDHVNGDGSAHRKAIKTGAGKMTGHNFYTWLRNNAYPDGFQVLCMNCNYGRYRNGGVCPHQEG